MRIPARSLVQRLIRVQRFIGEFLHLYQLIAL
jgi:hypothetical protein